MFAWQKLSTNFSLSWTHLWEKCEFVNLHLCKCRWSYIVHNFPLLTHFQFFGLILNLEQKWTQSLFHDSYAWARTYWRLVEFLVKKMKFIALSSEKTNLNINQMLSFCFVCVEYSFELVFGLVCVHLFMVFMCVNRFLFFWQNLFKWIMFAWLFLSKKNENRIVQDDFTNVSFFFVC